MENQSVPAPLQELISTILAESAPGSTVQTEEVDNQVSAIPGHQFEVTLRGEWTETGSLFDHTDTITVHSIHSKRTRGVVETVLSLKVLGL